uniref:Uncharacterized protein n=1 Tax=Micrurus lemniscatus lemniscatus TaxID=129467 RepID=A0A2D4JQK7_MICLE
MVQMYLSLLRSSRFDCVLCDSLPMNGRESAIGWVKGYLGFKPLEVNGFGTTHSAKFNFEKNCKGEELEQKWNINLATSEEIKDGNFSVARKETLKEQMHNGGYKGI